ncbi:MAG: NACHT domain-containing protein, partial [Myxococcales bacterium]|nr:NACHT domain-containing protein [Myxococcales bacterium]
MIGFDNRGRELHELDELFVSIEAVIDRELRGEECMVGPELDAAMAGGREQRESLSLPRAFARARELRRRALVLLGAPGAGKTTFAKRMLLLCARQGSEALGLPAGIVPVWVPLRALAVGQEPDLSGFISAQFASSQGLLPTDLGSRLVRHKLLLLLDGLDEVADADARGKVARWIEGLLRLLPESFVLVTCRYAGYTGNAVLQEKFLELHLGELDTAGMRSFVEQWYGVVEHELGPDVERARTLAVTRSAELLEVLNGKEVRAQGRIYGMTRNPL